jgi:hypothetical protein
MKTNQAKMDTWLAEMGAWQKEMTACQEAMDLSKETTSLVVEAEAEHEEVPKEEAAVKPGRELKKRHGDRNLAVGRRQRKGPRALVSPGRSWLLHHSCTA